MPHSAPAAMPPKNASVHISQPGTLCVGMPSAMNSVAAVPARYCPGAPMLNRPVLNATATESPVSISGVARNKHVAHAGRIESERERARRVAARAEQTHEYQPYAVPYALAAQRGIAQTHRDYYQRARREGR